ncbi:MAG: hypothetical protein ACTSRA_21610, partial [Promethearchaeota archaeon]
NYSRKGCIVDSNRLLNLFSVNSLEDLYWWVTAYITTGFITSIKPENVESARSICEDGGMHLEVIGSVTSDSAILLKYNDKQHELFNWERQPIIP